MNDDHHSLARHRADYPEHRTEGNRKGIGTKKRDGRPQSTRRAGVGSVEYYVPQETAVVCNGAAVISR